MMAPEMMGLFLYQGTSGWTVVLGPLLAGTFWELLDILGQDALAQPDFHWNLWRWDPGWAWG